MKKLGLVVLGAAVSSFAMASVCTTQPGIVKCGVGEAKEVVAYGLLDVKGSHIRGKTTFSGSLNDDDSVFTKTDGNGSSNLKNSVVFEESNFKGSVSSKNTKFKRKVHIYSSTASFDNSTARQSVVFHKLQKNEKQTLHLKNGSVINGDVTFESGNGEVLLSGNLRIEGHVVGGSVEKF